MYVAKFSRKGILWKVTLLEKVWSDTMQTHEVIEIGTKKALFHGAAGRWIRCRIAQEMVKRHELEILNG
jgi:hypothetical protein